MSQTAAGAEPDAAIGIRPECLAVAVVPNQPVFGAVVGPGTVSKDGNAFGRSPPEAAGGEHSPRGGERSPALEVRMEEILNRSQS